MYPPPAAEALLGGADPGVNVMGPFREDCCKDGGCAGGGEATAL